MGFGGTVFALGAAYHRIGVFFLCRCHIFGAAFLVSFGGAVFALGASVLRFRLDACFALLRGFFLPTLLQRRHCRQRFRCCFVRSQNLHRQHSCQQSYRTGQRSNTAYAVFAFSHFQNSSLPLDLLTYMSPDNPLGRPAQPERSTGLQRAFARQAVLAEGAVIFMQRNLYSVAMRVAKSAG